MSLKELKKHQIKKTQSTHTNVPRKTQTKKKLDDQTILDWVECPTDMQEITPITNSQVEAFEAWSKNSHLILSGAAGSGKTFIALYLALKEIIKHKGKKRLVIVRSVVPTRDIGFLPGTQEEKEAAYLTPYIGVISEIFKDDQSAFHSLVKSGKLQFLTTSFIRGVTIRDSIVVVDEFQNCNFHELDSILTRIGKGSRVIFSGDYFQSDFTHKGEREGINSFLTILDRLKYFKRVDFTWEDCVRSGLVREYLMTKEKMIEEGSLTIKK